MTLLPEISNCRRIQYKICPSLSDYMHEKISTSVKQSQQKPQTIVALLSQPNSTSTERQTILYYKYGFGNME